MKTFTTFNLVFFFTFSLFHSGVAKESLVSESEPVAAVSVSTLREADRVSFFIGQDLSAVRGYSESGCCPKPKGVTAYVGLYDLLNPAMAYQGLGFDVDGNLVRQNADWGGGETNAYKTALENAQSVLALAVSLTEDAPHHSLQAILDGEFDPQIAHLARFIEAVPNEVMLRLGYEFDGMWNSGYQNADRYKAVFRYIVQRLKSSGAQKFQTVWQASTSPIDDVLEGRSEDIQDWYPGDDVVDWMGLSWFMSPISKPLDGNAFYSSQSDLADEVLALARQRNKPVMIAESSPQGYDLDKLTKANISPQWDGISGENVKQLTAEQIWADWFEPFTNYINSNKDVIKVVAYINVDWDSQGLWGPPYANGYWGDTRLQNNKVLVEKWTRFVGD